MPNFNWNTIPPDVQQRLLQQGLGQFPVGQTQGIPQPGSAPQGQFRNPIPQAGMQQGMQQQPLTPPAMPQLASFQPQNGSPQNPFMAQVLNPLMQPNYGNPMVSPYGQQMGQPGATPGLGGQQIPRPVMQGATAQGLGRWSPDAAMALRA